MRSSKRPSSIYIKFGLERVDLCHGCRRQFACYSPIIASVACHPRYVQADLARNLSRRPLPEVPTGQKRAPGLPPKKPPPKRGKSCVRQLMAMPRRLCDKRRTTSRFAAANSYRQKCGKFTLSRRTARVDPETASPAAASAGSEQLVSGVLKVRSVDGRHTFARASWRVLRGEC